jgi:hypothetical protein
LHAELAGVPAQHVDEPQAAGARQGEDHRSGVATVLLIEVFGFMRKPNTAI